MKFRYSAPALLILMVVMAIAAQAIISNRISSHMTASSEAGQFTMMAQVIQSEMNGAQTKAAAGAELIAAIPMVKEAFAARNREQLLAITKDPYRVQHEKYGITQAQFHAMPSTSFLRVHNPAKFGEDLSGYRQMVVEVNRSMALRKGVEITTSGIGIFGTVPVTDTVGSHTGSFELGFEFGPMLDSIKSAYGFELAVYIDEKMLRETATSLHSDVLNEQNRVGKFVKFYSTHAELLRSLVTGEDIGIVEDVSYVRAAQGVPYGILLTPLYNFAHKQIGVLAVSRDFSATRAAAGQAIIYSALLALICAVILIGAVLIIIRGKVLQPLAQLTESMNALAEGDTSRAIEDVEVMCEELRNASESYEKMRTLQMKDAPQKSDPPSGASSGASS